MPRDVPATNLPFTEAIDFLQAKVRVPTRAYTDLKEGAHARSFVVAGATTDAILSDFHGAMVPWSRP